MKLGDLAGPGCALPPDAAAIEISGLTADSREVARGFLFAALPGTKADGRTFVPEALEKGAAAILAPEGVPLDVPVPVIANADPRRLLALMAARFHPARPGTIAAVTGTNGKTSVASFTRQIWQGLGHAAASLGTVGVTTAKGARPLVHTTPDPVALHAMLSELAVEGITHAALEASSHGLQQRRLDGIEFTAAGFTNISRDHLDYHATFEDYLAQKLRLFRELLPDGKPVVVDADAPGGDAILAVAKKRKLPCITVGHSGATLTMRDAVRDGFAQRLSVDHAGKTHDILLPLVGHFQTSNALVAAGLCIACGSVADDVLAKLESLKGARGRLDLAGSAASGAPVFVDYAHTPDALANALDALRPYAKRRLVVVFGCGGDRDKGKRPEMGRAASDKADLVYVTDDNPRSEDAGAIRAQILAAASGAIEIGDRREAIATAIAGLKKGDVLLVAGKGHETGQIVGDRVVPFSDHEAVETALKAETAHD